MIYVFNRNLSERWMLVNVESLMWNEKYCGIGTFSIVAGDTEENAKIIKKGNLLHYQNYDGIITSITVSNESITANGYSLAYLLNQRTAMNDTTITSVESGLYALYQSNKRGLDVDVAESKGFTETAEVAVTGGQIGTWAEEACKQCGLGFRVTLDVKTKKKLFEIYKGNDLTGATNPNAVHFSTATNTLSGLTIEDDDSEFCNVAIVRGQDLNEKYVVQIVGAASGTERKELFVDATSEPQQAEQVEYDDNGEKSGTIPAETTEEYKNRLIAIGQEALQERIGRLNFTLTVSPEDYGVRYGLGDIVLCNSVKHGIKMSARVSEVHYTIDRQKETIEIVLGEPKIRLKEMVKIWQM